MKHSRVAVLSAMLGLLPLSAALAADQDLSALHKRKLAARRTAVGPATNPQSSVTPMFEGSDRPETPADRAASLERRRKAFFAAPPADTATSATSPPVGVTLGGSNGLTPGMGMKF